MKNKGEFVLRIIFERNTQIIRTVYSFDVHQVIFNKEKNPQNMGM